MPRLSKHLRQCINFANGCHNLNLDPHDMAELLALAERAFHAGERAACHEGYEIQEQRAAAAFERKAEQLGFTVLWAGLYPTLEKNGCQYHLPDA